MMPHLFVVGTVTNAAREAIDSVGGGIEEAYMGMGMYREPAHRITLPSQARMGANNYDKQRGRFDARWCRIEIAGITLQFSNGPEDKGGTLDLAKKEGPGSSSTIVQKRRKKDDQD